MLTKHCATSTTCNLERLARIELANKPWQGFRLPLHHSRIKKLVKDSEKFWSTIKWNLATRGIQSRPTCLANMEYHLLSRIAQTVCPDPPPGWSVVYNYKIIKGFRPLMITLARLLDTLSLLLMHLFIVQLGGKGEIRTHTGHRMKVLHNHYATLPYRNTFNISSMLAQRTFRPCQGTGENTRFNCEVCPSKMFLYGRGTGNRTLINRLKAYYFSR